MPETWSMPGGSGERWADDYERGRPGWPEAAFEALDLPPEITVLEVGAGTGKLTALLVEQFRVLVLEPAEAMWNILEGKLPGLERIGGHAEAIGLPDDSVDAVFVAEAFHKFDGPRAVAEFARVLKPGGTLALLWNLPGGTSEPSVEVAERLLLAHAPADLDYEPLDLCATRYASGRWREPFCDSRFGPIEEREIAHTQTIDRKGLLRFYASMGWLGELPEEERAALLERASALLDAEKYKRPWRTCLHWTRMASK